MTDRESPGDLARALFEAARHDRKPSTLEERILEATLREQRRAPSGRGRRFYVALALAAVVAASVALFVQRRDEPVAIGPEYPSAREPVSQRIPPTAMPAPASAEPLAELAPKRTAPRPALRPSADTHAAAVASVPLVPASLSDEVALLDRARVSLKSGDPAATLRALDEYEHVLRGTRLSEEAKLLRIEALARSGQAESAARLAQAFIDANPGSSLAVRARTFVRTNGSGVSKVDGGDLK